EIYYAGGTASKDISSKDLTDEINKKGKKAVFFAERKDIVSECAKLAEPGDVVLIMGARDLSLSDFAQSVFEEIVAEQSSAKEVRSKRQEIRNSNNRK
ncbi:MAG: hypothetical protein KAJ48_08160, partial [Elusimicrobiales bacterium]|nr:hypothetical protein [Elusimicrobiales bacterium]